MIATFNESVRFLWQYLLPLKRRVALLLLLLLGGITLQLMAPQLIRQFLDEAQAGAAVRLMVETAVLYLIIVISQKAMSLLTTYIGEDVGWTATNQLRSDLATHCLHLDMGFHKLRTPGELIQRIDGDVSTLAEYFSRLIVHFAGNGLLMMGVIVLIFLEAWQFGLIALTYAVLMFAFQRGLRNPMTRIHGKIRQNYAELFSFLEERISSTEDIRANGGEDYVMNRLYGLMTAVTNNRIIAGLLGGLSFTSSYMLYVFALVGTLWLAAIRFQQGEMSLGTVYLMVFYIGLLETPLKYIRRQIENLQQAYASIGRINAFFQIQPQVQERVTAVLPNTAPSVQFESVTFAYKDRLETNGKTVNGQQSTINGQQSTIVNRQSSVLADINFTLEAGRILGVLGRTGSGKTTLTRLLFRLYDVDEGVIALHGMNLTSLGLTDLRRHVGMVTQDVQLFAATIRDNLTLFRNYDPDVPPITDAQIIAAIKTLGLESWFNGLPNGLDTMLKSGGKGLSAGEAQLLAFTRVFLRDPKLVILDEASSRLDPATEQLLERAVERLLHKRTGIIIAHRLHTVQRADDILILENGRIVEHGPRIQLGNDPTSRYTHLLQTGLEEVLA
jgi:ATP-binding cassette, subfamily B, bacterial